MLRYWLIPFMLALGLTWLFGQLGWPIWCAWLAAINLVAFLICGYDKAIAGSQSHLSRVPEIVLLALAFVGGYIGTFLGMQFFRHKTVKSSFQWKFWVVTILSIILTSIFVLILIQMGQLGKQPISFAFSAVSL